MKKIDEEKSKQQAEEEEKDEEADMEEEGVSLLFDSSKNTKLEQKGEGRGQGALDVVMPANFLLAYGAKPGGIVGKDTKLIKELSAMYLKYFDTETLTATFPDILEGL